MIASSIHISPWWQLYSLHLFPLRLPTTPHYGSLSYVLQYFYNFLFKGQSHLTITAPVKSANPKTNVFYIYKTIKKDHSETFTCYCKYPTNIGNMRAGNMLEW